MRFDIKKKKYINAYAVSIASAAGVAAPEAPPAAGATPDDVTKHTDSCAVVAVSALYRTE
jgi:hypothetical protein